MDECALSPCLVNAVLTVLARACRREKKKKKRKGNTTGKEEVKTFICRVQRKT